MRYIVDELGPGDVACESIVKDRTSAQLEFVFLGGVNDLVKSDLLLKIEAIRTRNGAPDVIVPSKNIGKEDLPGERGGVLHASHELRTHEKRNRKAD